MRTRIGPFRSSRSRRRPGPRGARRRRRAGVPRDRSGAEPARAKREALPARGDPPAIIVRGPPRPPGRADGIARQHLFPPALAAGPHPADGGNAARGDRLLRPHLLLPEVQRDGGPPPARRALADSRPAVRETPPPADGQAPDRARRTPRP